MKRIKLWNILLLVLCNLGVYAQNFCLTPPNIPEFSQTVPKNRIELYNSAYGQKIKTLVPRQNLSAGAYSVQASVARLNTGTYIVRATSGDQVESKQLILKK